MAYTKLDETISRLSVKLQKIKYKAVDEMVNAILAECKDYRRALVRKAVIYYFFD